LRLSPFYMLLPRSAGPGPRYHTSSFTKYDK
jgi:hypothetical protein